MTTGALELDGENLFVVHDGKRIASRGHPGTPQARTWVPLEPGYTVYSSPDFSVLTVEYDPPASQ